MVVIVPVYLLIWIQQLAAHRVMLNIASIHHVLLLKIITMAQHVHSKHHHLFDVPMVVMLYTNVNHEHIQDHFKYHSKIWKNSNEERHNKYNNHNRNMMLEGLTKVTKIKDNQIIVIMDQVSRNDCMRKFSQAVEAVEIINKQIFYITIPDTRPSWEHSPDENNFVPTHDHETPDPNAKTSDVGDNQNERPESPGANDDTSDLGNNQNEKPESGGSNDDTSDVENNQTEKVESADTNGHDSHPTEPVLPDWDSERDATTTVVQPNHYDGIRLYLTDMYIVIRMAFY